MSYPHTIRLRGPWQCEIEDQVGVRRVIDCELPHQLEDESADVAQTVRYRRAFGAPASLSATERVWLVVEGASAKSVAWLNGQLLCPLVNEATTITHVTEGLRSRNTLEIAMMRGADGRSPFEDAFALSGPVNLEITGPARLADIKQDYDIATAEWRFSAVVLAPRRLRDQGAPPADSREWEVSLAINVAGQERFFQSALRDQERVSASFPLMPAGASVEFIVIAQGLLSWRLCVRATT